jgi:diguanylate cyclase (GGDEF)-like protein
MLGLPGSEQKAPSGDHAAAADAYRRLAGVVHTVLSEESHDALRERIGAALAELVPHDALTGRWEGHEPVHLDDAVAGELAAESAPVPSARLSLQLVARGRAKGSLDVFRNGAAAFSPHELELARGFADALALAFDNAEIRLQLEHRAQSDSLTGLLNHRTFHQRLRMAVAEAEPACQPVAVLMLDLDDFKRVNDVHGHAAGDDVLQRFSGLLSQAVRGSDLVCRAGGEEFAVILPGADSQGARIIAARLAEAIASERFAAAGALTASMGIAHFPLHASTARELAVCAEAAMMTAKAQGKDQIVVFDEESTGRPDLASDGRDARALAHLRLLQTLIGRLGRLGEPAAVGRLLAADVCPLAEVSGCRVYAAEGERLTALASAGTLDEPGRDYGFGEGLAGRAAATGRPELACGTESGSDAGWAAAVPLLVDGGVVGVIVVTQTGDRRLDDHDVRLLEVLAGPAAVALENARLYQAALRDAADARAELATLRASSTRAA